MPTLNRKNMDINALVAVDLRALERFATNPLLEPQRVQVRPQKRVATGRDASDWENVTTVVTEELVDRSQFVKIFDAGIRAAYDLRLAGYKVYQLVLKITGQGRMNDDQIILHPSMVKDAPVQMSEDTYQRGLRELISKRFLAAGIVPHTYWLNPHFFVKGDVLQIVRRYQRRKEAPDETQEQTVTTPSISTLSPSLFDEAKPS